MDDLKADAMNKERGNLTGYDCPLCLNKGYIVKVKDHTVVTVECECMTKRRNLKKLEESGLKEIIETYRFDNYETLKPWQRNAKKKAQDFVEKENGWFVICGTPGTGKTHLCTAICGAFLEKNKAVRYMVWREDAPKLKACVNERDQYEKMMNELKSADVLYIDDFWKGSVTDADINLSFELLNSRYNNRSKITIISGEKSIEQMLDIDQAVGSKIYELSKGFVILTPEENYRLR